jgi:xylulokinase
MSTTGASLKWFRDQFADSEKQLARERGVDVYDVLTAEAAEASAGSGNLVFLPYLMGERAPVWDSAARGTLFGLTLHTKRADVIRAILEGVAFGVYHNVQEARALGLQLSRLMAVGGGNSRLWFRIMASMLNMPISIPASSSGAPFGAAVLAGAGVGLIGDLRAFIRGTLVVAETIEPIPAWRERYEQLFEVYLDLYRHTKDDMHRLTAMSASPNDPVQ